MGLYSAHKLEGERLKCFALSISMQIKAIGSQFTVPGTEKYPTSSGKLRQSCYKITIRVRPFRLFFLFWPRGSKVRIRKVLLCPFHCKARPSGVSLAPFGLENISQVPPDRAEVGQGHDARKALSVSLSV